MKATVEIDMGNAAFADFPGAELARILEGLACEVRSLEDGEAIGIVPLFDVNGNRVGRLVISD